MARIPLSDKASPKECEDVYELLDHVVLENRTRGRSHEFPNTCMECDDDGLSLIFGKILNDGVIELKPSDFFASALNAASEGGSRKPSMESSCERRVSRNLSMESLCERRMSRGSSLESFDTRRVSGNLSIVPFRERNLSRASSLESTDTKVMDDFEKYPVYCMQSGPVAKQAVVQPGTSSVELGTEPQGNNSMVTPVRKRRKQTENLESEQKDTKVVVTSEPNLLRQNAKEFFLPLPDLGFVKSDCSSSSSADISLALATAPPAPAAPKQKKGGNKRKAKGHAVKKSVSMTMKKEANHGEPVVELGQGKVMTKHLIYNRAYKRVRLAEVKKGTKDDEAKQMAAEQARNAVSIFLDGLQT